MGYSGGFEITIKDFNLNKESIKLNDEIKKDGNFDFIEFTALVDKNKWFDWEVEHPVEFHFTRSYLENNGFYEATIDSIKVKGRYYFDGTLKDFFDGSFTKEEIINEIDSYFYTIKGGFCGSFAHIPLTNPVKFEEGRYSGIDKSKYNYTENGEVELTSACLDGRKFVNLIENRRLFIGSDEEFFSQGEDYER